MRYLKIAFALLFVLSLNDSTVRAQDPEFTQFYANQLYLNPAFAGTSRCPRLVMNYRNQWPSISGTFVTYSLGYDQYVNGLGGGFGLLVNYDDAGKGVLTTARVSGIYSKHLAINSRSSINFGFEGGIHQRAIDVSLLTFGDQIDPNQGIIGGTSEDDQNINGSIIKPDFSAGALYYSKYVFAGLAAHHLVPVNESLLTEAGSESLLPMKITGHMGAVIPIKGMLGGGTKGAESSISPNVLYQRQQDFQQLNLGLYVKKGALVSGLWYRNSDAFIVLVGIEQDMIKLGYSYDLTVSRLGSTTAGSHELSFQMQFPCRPPRKKLRAIQCPSF